MDRATALAAELLEAAEAVEGRQHARQRRRVARLVQDEASRAFVQQLTDQVLRIDDPRRAADRFHDLVTLHPVPTVAGPLDRVALGLGARVAPLWPRPVMALVTRRLRREATGIILPAEDPALARHLADRRAAGFGQNVNPLGEAVLGEVEAERRLETVLATIRRPDVDYVSVKITAIYSQVDPLAFDHTVDVLSDRLRRLFRAGREAGTFVNLDMEAYDDLHLTVAAFRRVLDEGEFADLDAGIVLQAYIPDSVAVLEDLVAWGRPIKVRIVKGANLAMERVEAELRGWPQAPYTTKAEVDANYKRLLDLALAGGVRIGAASHNLFDIAWALVAAEEAGAQDRLEIEMLEGMAPAQAEAVRRRVGQLLLYAPVVAHDDFQAAIAYLVRRLDENTAAENFLHHLFTLTPGSPDWDDQRARFEKSVVDRHHVERAPRRDQDRTTEERSFDPDEPLRQRARHRLHLGRQPALGRRPHRRLAATDRPGGGRPGRRRAGRGHRPHRRRGVGGASRGRAPPGAPPGRRGARRPPGRSDRRHGPRRQQDDRRGRPRGVRGHRLRHAGTPAAGASSTSSGPTACASTPTA